MGEIGETVKEAVERQEESRLNSVIAVVVALAATFMALSNVKDGNIGQAMSREQAVAIDSWTYYQAKSMKQNLAEATLDQLVALRTVNGGRAAEAAVLDKRIETYAATSRATRREERDQVAGRRTPAEVRRAQFAGRPVRSVRRRHVGVDRPARRHRADAETMVARGRGGVPLLWRRLWRGRLLRPEGSPRRLMSWLS